MSVGLCDSSNAFFRAVLQWFPCITMPILDSMGFNLCLGIIFNYWVNRRVDMRCLCLGDFRKIAHWSINGFYASPHKIGASKRFILLRMYIFYLFKKIIKSSLIYTFELDGVLAYILDINVKHDSCTILKRITIMCIYKSVNENLMYFVSRFSNWDWPFTMLTYLNINIIQHHLLWSLSK